ncbi:MAG: LysM peptidoglycan-binding domain-containing protein [Bacteroidia bacterium]
MKKLFSLLVASLLYVGLSASPAVPETMKYCGMELSLDAGARTAVEEVITKIKHSTVHFQSMVDRANIYFPFIEEALSLRAVPDDLKYIVIMESSFVADAVSSSNAVGFWQFKDQSARESGIVIDEYVDERKHIFRSSLGAAKYFYTIAKYFDNYLYAVVGYNRGPVGALPFIDADYLGNRKMRITKETHWYALKAIAHKLAFEDAVRKSDPPMWLQPMSTAGETEVSKLASAAGLSVEDFKKYNLWIKGSKLPEGRNFIYYLPRQGKQDLALLRHVRGGERRIGGGATVKPVEQPKATVQPVKTSPRPTRDTRRFSYVEQDADPDYGLEYVRMKPGESLVEVAVRYHLKPQRLRDINLLSNAYRPKEGDLVYLKPPQSRRVHIVQPGETLRQIAHIYGVPEAKIQSKNRMTGATIYAHQKLSLKKKVAKGTKPTLLAPKEDEEIVAIEDEPIKTPEKPVETPKEQPKEEPVVVIPSGNGVLEDDPASYKLPGFESQWVTHKVVQGESVWKVSKKYGAFAEVVKKVNGLSSNDVSPGTELKILQVKDL